MRSYLEFGVYFYIMVFASPFMFLVSLNEIAAFEVGSGFKAVSYVFAFISFLLLIVIAFLPVISLLMKKTEKHFFNGLKDTWAAKIFYTTVMAKFLAFSFIFIVLDLKEAQVSAFLLVLIISCVYLVQIKPFAVPISNLLVIMNEGMLLLIGLLMISFLESSLNHDSLPKIIIYTLSANIIICFALALFSQVYSLYKKCKKKNISIKADEVIRVKPDSIRTPKMSNPDNQLDISKILFILISSFLGNIEESKEDRSAISKGNLLIIFYQSVFLVVE